MQDLRFMTVSGDSGGRFLGATSDRSDIFLAGSTREIERSEFDLSLPVGVSSIPDMLPLVLLHIEFRVEMDLES